MMGEFLLLMVFLDKFWFGPVGAVLDARDKELRSKLSLVKDNGSEVGPTARCCCSSSLRLLATAHQCCRTANRAAGGQHGRQTASSRR
jgi:hypothetical protein